MAASKKVIKIVCMGDSITEGFGLGEDASVFYPSALNEYLGNGFEVFNKGVTCSCVTNVEIDGNVVGLPYARQQRYSEALKIKGDIYIVMLGTNDASDGTNDQTGKKEPLANLVNQIGHFSDSYTEIVKDIKKASPKAKIFLVTPIPIMDCIWKKHREEYLAKLIPYIRKIARDNKLDYIDLHREYLMFPSEQIENLYLPDGLHPNITGAQVIASIIAGYIVARK